MSDQADQMAPDASPGAVSKKSGVRRVNNMPMYILAAALGIAYAAFERAHVLAQTHTIRHVCSHIAFLRWAIRARDWREAAIFIVRDGDASDVDLLPSGRRSVDPQSPAPATPQGRLVPASPGLFVVRDDNGAAP